MTVTPGDSFALPILVARLRAAGETTRLRLLALLAAGELTVSELTQILGQSQPRVSRHLKLLVEAELIERLPEGSWVFYRLREGEGPNSAGAFVRRLLAELKRADPLIVADQARRTEVTAGRADVAARYFAANAAEWDRIRALYIPEAQVEAAMLDLLKRPAGAPLADLLVDLGTGTGRVLEVLAPLYKRAVGFDVSHAMLSVARVNLERACIPHVHVRHGDLFAVPVAAASADTVVLHQVLHYLDNPGAAISAAARLLSPDGRLLVVDFAPHGLEFLRNDHAHRRLGFTEDDIARWCRAAGLEIRSVRHLTPAPGAGQEQLTVSLWLAGAPVSAARERPLESVS